MAVEKYPVRSTVTIQVETGMDDQLSHYETASFSLKNKGKLSLLR